MSPPTGDLSAYRQALIADLARVSARDRWPRACFGIAWLHLAYCLVYQALYVPDGSRAAISLALWASEVAAVIGLVRWVAGRGWHRATPLAGVVVRVWATYLILTLSVATLNSLTGWTLDWFKLVWCTLGSFGFATMAWLLNLRFLIPAFQMYFTGLLMAHHPGLAYLIHGLSWWLALHGIGLVLLARRAGAPTGDDAPLAGAGWPGPLEISPTGTALE